MAFRQVTPSTIASDSGYAVEFVHPYLRYSEGDRSARVEIDSFGDGGNAFLGIPGDGVQRWGLYAATFKAETPGRGFTRHEQVQAVRRIVAAYAWAGMRVKVIDPVAEDFFYQLGED